MGCVSHEGVIPKSVELELRIYLEMVRGIKVSRREKDFTFVNVQRLINYGRKESFPE